MLLITTYKYLELLYRVLNISLLSISSDRTIGIQWVGTCYKISARQRHPMYKEHEWKSDYEALASARQNAWAKSPRLTANKASNKTW